MKSNPCSCLTGRHSPADWQLIAVFAIAMAALPARLLAQSFPAPGSMKDFSDTVVETPNTAMALDPNDVPEVQPEPDYPGIPAAVQPEQPDTPPTNYEGPIGVTGVIDNVTTGGSYSPLSHNALRGPITDIDVPGALGKYGLKMRRYYNSRSSQYWDNAIALSPGWFHEYSWLLWSAGYKVISAQGNVTDFFCIKPVGASEGWDDGVQARHANGGVWRLADGGRVHFSSGGNADYIEDPYGLRTTITRDNQHQNRVSRVTEPGGRYLQFIYGTTSAYIDPAYGNQLLKTVEAYDGQGHFIERVTYTYRNVDSGGIIPTTGEHVIRKMLTGVAYDDNTSASYTYRTDNVPDAPPSTFKFDPLLASCNDKRYAGPMRQISYEYQPLGPHGAIRKEYKPNGPLVSKIDPDLSHPNGGWLTTQYTETRGDGQTRTFTYTPFKTYYQNPQEPEVCLDVSNNAAEGRSPQQMLTDYTDFQQHTTHIGYDPATWYITSVRDANGNTTSYERGNPSSQDHIGEIKKITHPGGSYIQYAYQPETGALDGHYITSVTDENQKLTTIRRDPTRHWITEIIYPSDGNTPASSEVFSDFDNFGHPRTHQLRNGAYEKFLYDGRGLLTDKYNPNQTRVPGGTDPRTHYDYYTAVDGKPGWIDRVKKVTMPANWLGYVASETYEYDKKSDGTACAGRGLVTKITHADNKNQSFQFDQWGNKWKEWNELGEATTYVYDSYNRVKTVTKWMYSTPNEITTYDYAPTEGDQTQASKHTSNSPYWVTAPTAVKTHNVYDENWRTTSSQVANNTPTMFDYDNVGNLRFVTDPNGHATETDYDPRNRKWHVWDAQRHQTTFSYDNASNVTRVDHLADGSWESKTYDAVNRVLTDKVSAGTLQDPSEIVTTFNYNPSGTLNWVKDGENHQTSFSYDASDRRKTMTYQNAQTQSWAYDDAGNMKSRTTVNGETLLLGYDNRNRKYGETWWDENAEWRYFELDAASRLRRALNGTGLWFANQFADVHRNYDHAGRLTLDKQDIDGENNGLGPMEVHYEYNTALRGTDGKPTLMYVNHLGDGYDYDYRYDEMGRFEKILRNGGTLYFQYSYDNASNETQRHNQRNGVDQFYNPDSLNRIGKVELKKNGTRFAYEDYGYWANGRLYSVTREDNLQNQFGYYLDGELSWVMYGVSGAAGPDPGATPPADDPSKAKTPGDLLSLGMEPDYTQTYQRAVAYVYDKAGNRLGINDNGAAVTVYTPNNINQYQSISINNVADPIINGNEHEVTSYKNVSYTYMKDEHLTRVTSGTSSYDLAYDALGRCVKRTVRTQMEGVEQPDVTPRPDPTPHPRPSPPPPSPTPSPSPTPPGQVEVITYYFYDGERPILEFDQNGEWFAENLYGKGIDEILMRYDPTLSPDLRTFYYQQDHEGSVTHLTDASGNVIEKYRYDVFGNPVILSPTNQGRTASIVSNRFMFTGREFSNLFGFYEYRARAYNPLLGRFMSEDPKLFVRRTGLGASPADWSFGAHPDEAEFNLFRYCGNDPIDFTDPMGLDPVAVSPEANALALQADTRNLSQMYENSHLFGLIRYEFSTSVYQDTRGNLSLSQSRTDYRADRVQPPSDPQKTSVVETHNHIVRIDNSTTHSTLSRDDVHRGDQTGRPQEVISPDGTRDRYRPSDKATFDQRVQEGGVIERFDKNSNTWTPLPGANTNLNDLSDHRNGPAEIRPPKLGR